jgi:rubrerythrin
MKLIRASAVPGVLERMQAALESEGIPCQMRNELTAGLSPEIPLSESMPELWIVEDDMLHRALQVIEAIKSAPSTEGGSWTCPECGEVLEPQFSSCWKCDAPKPG